MSDRQAATGIRKRTVDARGACHFVLARQFVLPNPQDTPTGGFQRFPHQAVSVQVAGQLSLPKRTVRPGLGPVQRTPVPKTAIDEDRQSLSREGEVWMAENRVIAPPPRDFPLPEQSQQSKFGR
jgi:hypothetical protein